ncbi:MAG: PAS domain S-box protein [Methanoregula sp.]|nr:PAS domain S-box protein [Methanoregula sp.]
MVLKKKITEQIKDVLKENPQGLSIKDIVKAVNINRNTVGRYLENLLVSGQVEMRRFGMAKIYMLSQRVPLYAVLSLSSELVMQLDSSLRIIFVNEPFLKMIETKSENLIGKNIEYTPVVTTFYDSFPWLLRKIQEALNGKETSGEISPQIKNLIFFFRIRPTVFENGRKGVSVILEDITQRKQSENALLESEVKLRSITENSPDRILLLNPKLEIIFINRTIELNPEQVLGKSVFDFISQEFHHAAAESFEHVVKTGELSTYGTEYHFANGETLYFESTVGPVFQDGTVTALVVNAHDITKRRKAEKVLQESEDRYRKLVEISPDAVLIHQQGKIIFMNSAALNILGASNSDEIIGKNLLDFIEPGFHEILRKNIKKDLEGDITPPIEVHMLRIDGTSVIVEGRGVKTTINGKPAIQVAIRDITKQKQTEEILKKSEKMYRSLVETTGTGYVIIDKAGRVISANQEYIRLTGRSSLAEIEGRSAIDWTASYDIERNAREIEQVFKNGQVRDLEVDYQRPDGSIQPIEINASVIQYDSDLIVLALCRDIAERRCIEMALRESEGKLNAMLQSISDPMSMMDENLTIIWANEPAKRLFGKDIIGKKCYEAYHLRRDPCDPYPCLTLKAFRDGKIHHHETTVIDSQGESRFFDCSSNVALRDASGKPVAVLEISRDITDRKKAELALHQNDDRLRRILNSTDDLIIMQDTEGRYLYFNSAARYGVSAEDVLGLTPYDFVDRESADRLMDRLKNVVKTGQSIREETPMVWKGQALWFSDSLSPVRDKKGTITAVVTISQNITERKRADMALRESEEKYRNLVNQANDVICVIQDGVVKMCNPRLTEFWGGPVEEILGRPFTEFVHPDALSKVVDCYNRRMAGESPPSRFESILMRKDGSRSLVDVTASIISYEGKTADLVITRDINEQRKAEDALRESEATARALMNAPTDSVILMDTQGIILALNETAAVRFGKRIDELVGVLADDLLPEEVARLRRSLITQVLEKKTMVRFKDERNGIWFDTVAYPILNETGDVIKIAIVARDITDRKNADR